MGVKFNECVKNGGKVRTIVVNEKQGKYMHVCYPKGSNKAIAGEVHTKGDMMKK